MRLIDADELLKSFDNRIAPEVLHKCPTKYYLPMYNDIKECIKEQPTAYDIEQVEEQLKRYSLKMSFKRKDHLWSFTWLRAISLKRALDIVRKGGINGK